MNVLLLLMYISAFIFSLLIGYGFYRLILFGRDVVSGIRLRARG